MEKSKEVALPISSAYSDLSEEHKEIIKTSLTKTWSMPKFKAEYFVGHAQITPYGAMKQYILEVNSREGTIINLEYERDKVLIEVARLERDLTKLTDEFDIQEVELEIKHKKIGAISLSNKLKGMIEERDGYIALIEELNNSEFGTLPDGTKLFEAIQDKERSEELERDYWVKRLGKQAAMDMVAYGRVGVGNMDSITMLSKEDQRKTLELASDVLVWNENRMQHILSESNQRYLSADSEMAKQLKLTKD